MLRRRSIGAVMAALLVGCTLGCGGEGAHSKPTSHLSGSVSINGKPVPDDAEGSIVFQPDGGGGQAHPTEAKIIDSKYDAPNVPQGNVKAYFNIGRLTGRMISEDGGPLFEEMEQLAPEEAQVGIAIEVTGDAEKNFEL